MNHIIEIETLQCIGCGLCVQDCPASNIRLHEKTAQIIRQDCIKCGHCVAICPKNAVHISGYQHSPLPLEPLQKLSSDELLYAIRSRRSIRHFDTKTVDPSIIEQIIEAGRWSPTAKNTQGVEYLLIEKTMHEVEQTAVTFFRRLLCFIKLFNSSLKEFEIDDHFFFKQAPIAIALLSNNKVDASLAASNMALMAESFGLGVLYSGFFTVAANLLPSIKKALDLKRKKVVTTLVIGYPNVHYRRIPQREEAVVHFK